MTEATEPTEPVPVRYRLVLRATPRLRRLAVVAALAVASVVVFGRGELAVLAAAPLVLLAVSPRSALPRTLTTEVALHPTQAVEGDELVVTVRVATGALHRVEARLALPPHGDLERERRSGGEERPGHVTFRWRTTVDRWGRHDVGPVRLRAVTGHGLYAGELDLALPQVTVYPASGAVADAVAPQELPSRLGEHASRAHGSGVEYAGVRTYSVGDRRRDIDWRTSARHQELFVRQYAAERGFDLILLLDVGVDVGPAGRSSLDLTVRAATGLARSYLDVHDRVGLVTVGGWSRWLTPAPGVRQLHRVAELVMNARRDDAGVDDGLVRVPRRVLPPGAFVCVLSPLLDDRMLAVVRDLHERGLGLLVVDVLTTEPEASRGSGMGELALRVWRLEREAGRVELARLGVPVLSWDGTGDLSGALRHAMRGTRPGARA